MSHPAVVSVQSRECSPELLERLSGSTLFPERPAGAAIVSVVRRGGGSLFYVAAPAMVDADEQVEYFLGLLPEEHEGQLKALRDRVEVGSLDDRSSRWLSTKLLDGTNPAAGELRERIHAFVARERAAGADVRLDCFEPSANLEELAASLGMPANQADASVIPLGTKASGRRIFLDAGVPVVAGTDEFHSVDELAGGITDLVEAGHRKLVLKLSSTEFGAGMGNALLDLGATDLPADREGVRAAVAAALPTADLVDPKLTWAQYAAMITTSGVVAERWVEGDEVRSPSFQGRIAEDGTVTAVSVHDQVLGGAGLTYVGSCFPADAAYRSEALRHGLAVGARLVANGVRRGDYGVDFLAVREGSRWQVLGCELNLRATGTKHGFTMATALLDTVPDPDGDLVVGGSPRVYEASDGIADPSLVGVRPSALIDAVRSSPLHYDPVTRTGVVLHLLSALPTYGKFGAICIGRDRGECERMMRGLRELALALGNR
ncbi:peptide ligase PGM1-related protein [Actinosynnema sp. NPDC023658]|uniref:peptide ligase PGM1-related protein n=1 Tax=Actinosynnema sp. NPDC023658 TaxID=3155465 RepID=UPI0033F0386E